MSLSISILKLIDCYLTDIYYGLSFKKKVYNNLVKC